MKKNQYNFVFYFCFSRGYKSPTTLSEKVKLLTNSPKCWSVSAAAPWLLAKTLFCVARTYSWTWMSACLCVLLADRNLIYSNGGGSWLWGCEIRSSSWAFLCGSLQYHHVLGTCANGLGCPYCYCAQQAHHSMNIHNPKLSPSVPPTSLLSLSTIQSASDSILSFWSGCAWLIAMGPRGLGDWRRRWMGEDMFS